ncbi:MAG TPA: AsmA-like C-terminal region-containing protein, partial [Alphaproteobacteria bacterium]|nr:AsmA-like C-terminal region-containing protein [Alphaproteobacteria bacterium]
KGTAQGGKRTVNVDINLSADGSSTADVKTDFVDMNNWFAETPTVQADTEMALQAQKLFWRDLTVEKAVADLVMKKDGFEARKLAGLLWGGQLDLSSSAKRDGKKWQGRVTGTLKNADLAPLLTMTGLKGVAVGRGDIVFDLAGIGDTKGLKEATGTLSLTLDSLTLDAFDPAALADFVRAQKSLPDDLGTRLHKAMRENGSSTFADVSLDLKVADNKVEITNLTLGNADVNMQVNGMLDLTAENYDVKAETVLKNLPDIGGLSITRKGAAARASDYRFDIAGIKAWIESRMPPPVAEEMPVVTDDLYIMPDVPATGVESVPLDAPPTFEEDVMLPADDSVEIEKLSPPDMPQTDTGVETRDTLKGILDRLEETPPAEDEILPPE